MPTIFTIGYEGASLDDFLATLKAVGVEQVLDIRELPQSRRRGFSKNVLAAALEGSGIAYRHMKQLGDPKHGRDAARRGDMEEFRAVFSAHMDLPASIEAVQDAAQRVENTPTVLLCYERDHRHCHRTLVVDRILRLGSFEVRHLGVRHGCSEHPVQYSGAEQHA